MHKETLRQFDFQLLEVSASLLEVDFTALNEKRLEGGVFHGGQRHQACSFFQVSVTEINSEDVLNAFRNSLSED